MDKIRVLVAKPGLDGHDRGAKVIARAFMEAGFEVIYTGLRKTPEDIVQAALEEDVDCIAVSILSGAHNYLIPKIIELIKENSLNDVLLITGGIIPMEDAEYLKGLGVAGIFTPGTSTKDTVEFVRDNVRRAGHDS